jgi:putative SOS response-associated peptidase YedK
MCFHSKQSKDAQTLQNRYNARLAEPDLFVQGDFNGFSHPYCAIITNNRQEIIQFAQWGLLPDWAKDKSLQNNTLNAKLETIGDKPSFKNYQTQRCLIPADGFYEWQWLDPAGKKKQKYLVHLPGDPLFSFAGLWNQWRDIRTGEVFHTYTILTTEANALMSVIHNSKKRMPVILNPDAEKAWLNNGELLVCNDHLVADPINEPGVATQLELF